MKKQSHADEMKKDLDIMLSKINALEVVASGEYQKGVECGLSDTRLKS